MTASGVGVHRDAFTDEIVASDTFEVPAQGKFYIAGEEVSERVYRRHEQLCDEVERFKLGVEPFHPIRWRTVHIGTPHKRLDVALTVDRWKWLMGHLGFYGEPE